MAHSKLVPLTLLFVLGSLCSTGQAVSMDSAIKFFNALTSGNNNGMTLADVMPKSTSPEILQQAMKITPSQLKSDVKAAGSAIKQCFLSNPLKVISCSKAAIKQIDPEVNKLLSMIKDKVKPMAVNFLTNLKPKLSSPTAQRMVQTAINMIQPSGKRRRRKRAIMIFMSAPMTLQEVKDKVMAQLQKMWQAIKTALSKPPMMAPSLMQQLVNLIAQMFPKTKDFLSKPEVMSALGTMPPSKKKK